MSGKGVQVFVIMGVAGSGKTTVGNALAARLQCPFYDGDDFHPPANVAKMATGVPLDDADREPWLASLAALIQRHLQQDQSAVLACSALKRRYRDLLRINEKVKFIFLEGDFDLIMRRIANRQDHYMRPEMLRSQFEALEPPDSDEALLASIDGPVDTIVADILQQLDSEFG